MRNFKLKDSTVQQVLLKALLIIQLLIWFFCCSFAQTPQKGCISVGEYVNHLSLNECAINLGECDNQFSIDSLGRIIFDNYEVKSAQLVIDIITQTNTKYYILVSKKHFCYNDSYICMTRGSVYPKWFFTWAFITECTDLYSDGVFIYINNKVVTNTNTTIENIFSCKHVKN